MKRKFHYPMQTQQMKISNESWHLQGSGGYRIGNVTSLNESNEFNKIILKK
jgi:hypothetical protein